MTTATKRKTSLSLDSRALEDAKQLGLNISALAEEALINAVAAERRKRWLSENAEAFAEQSAWHDEHGHPLAEIMTSPGASSWQN